MNKRHFVLNLDRISEGRTNSKADDKQAIIKGYILSNEGGQTIPVEKSLVLAINRNLLLEYAGSDPGFEAGTVLQAYVYADLAAFDDSGFLDPDQEYCGIVIKPGIQ